MGYASAIGYALFVIIMIFTLIQMKVLKFNKEVDE
jgi:ABC-type sugar transport system permease subunit